jgi:hypothetical protein
MAYSLLISPISGDESGFCAGLMVLLRITQLPRRKRCARGCLGDEGDETGSRRPGLVIAASAGLIAAAGEMQADTRTGSRSPDQGACAEPSAGMFADTAYAVDDRGSAFHPVIGRPIG